MKTNNKIEVIKTMEKAFRDYDFLFKKRVNRRYGMLDSS